MDTKESLIRIILLSFLLYSALSLAASGRELHEALARQEQLNAQLAAVDAERQAMQARMNARISPEEIAQLARQRLGLVRPGEKIFNFTDREDTPWNWK